MKRFAHLTSFVLVLLLAFALQGGALVRVAHQAEPAHARVLSSPQICDAERSSKTPAQPRHEAGCSTCLLCGAMVASFAPAPRAVFALRFSVAPSALPDQSRGRSFIVRAASHAPRAPPSLS